MTLYQRKLGNTGLSVSEIGYGAWGIGADMWIGAKDDTSLDALHRYLELGGNFIDTAMGYGSGHSEHLVGQAVRAYPKAIIATKISPMNLEWPAAARTTAGEAFPGEYVIRMTDYSLQRLGRPYIDVQQFHVWNDSWLGQGDWQDAIALLKRNRKIRHFGISINDHQPNNAVKAVENGVVETVQVIYNVFDQSPQDRLLDACQQHGVGVIVRVALDEGSLTGNIRPDTQFDVKDWRNHYFSGNRKTELQTHLRAIEQDLGIKTDHLAETSLRFVLSHPAVSTVIVGMRSVQNVERNAAIADGAGLTAEQVQKLHAHRWDRNWYEATE